METIYYLPKKRLSKQKKILVISLNKYKLSEYEFSYPLKNQLRRDFKVDIINFIPLLNIKKINKFLKRYDLIILSGTSLKDYYYLFYWKKFYFLKKPIKKIGICSGAQVLALVYGYKLYKLKNKKIGVYYENDEKRFYLTSYLIKKDNKILRKIKTKNCFILTYHPEVFNNLKTYVNHLLHPYLNQDHN